MHYDSPDRNPARAALSRAVNRAIAEGSPIYTNHPVPQQEQAADFAQDVSICSLTRGEAQDLLRAIRRYGAACRNAGSVADHPARVSWYREQLDAIAKRIGLADKLDF
jgi:7,8-dihydro-6-hydroxymethylpterin-pyrophosphokinase